MVSTAATGGSGWSASCAQRAEAVEHGHLHVDQRDVGVVAVDRVEQLRAVADVGDHLDPAVGLQQHLQPGAQQRLVVGEHDPDPHAAPPLAGAGHFPARSQRSRPVTD